MGLGIRGAPPTVGADDSEAGTCSHLRLRHLAQVSAAKDAEQTHRAGRKASAPPRNERPAPPTILPIVGGRYVTRRGAAKTTLLHNTTSSIMALSSSFTGFCELD